MFYDIFVPFKFYTGDTVFLLYSGVTARKTLKKKIIIKTVREQFNVS